MMLLFITPASPRGLDFGKRTASPNLFPHARGSSHHAMKSRYFRVHGDSRSRISGRSSRRRMPGAEPYPVVPTPTPSRTVAYSFVIPMKDRASRVVELHHQIVEILGDQAEFELIFIDDASRDRTWRAIN